MHQIKFWLGLYPRHVLVDLTALSKLQNWILGVLLLREEKGEGKEREGKKCILAVKDEIQWQQLSVHPSVTDVL